MSPISIDATSDLPLSFVDSPAAAGGEPLGPKIPGAFRVLHTADWHLGKMLAEYSRDAEHDCFLSFLLKTIIEQDVDALIVAGDVFDSGNPPQQVMSKYYDFLARLRGTTHCGAVIVAGNHDSPHHLEAPRPLLTPLNVHVIGTLPEDLRSCLVVLPDAKNPKLVVAAVPFLRDRDLRLGRTGQSSAEIQQDLVDGMHRRYQELAEAAQFWRNQGLPVIATGHLTVLGSRASDSERDIHVGGLGSVSPSCFPEAFAYVALGHLHRPQQAGNRENVRYSGSPIPLSFSEASDRKEVRILDFADGALIRQTGVAIPQARCLVQVRRSRSILPQTLKELEIPACELPPWLEVIVEDPLPGENLAELASLYLKPGIFDKIRVVSRSTTPAGSLTTLHPDAAEAIETELGDPAKVFQRRLADEPALTEEQRAALTIAFQELRNLHFERQTETLPLFAIASRS